MRKLNGMVVMPNQDPDECLTEGFQQRDKVEHIGESLLGARILDLILEAQRRVRTHQIRHRAGPRDLAKTDRYHNAQNANRVVRGSGSTFFPGKDVIQL